VVSVARQVLVVCAMAACGRLGFAPHHDAPSAPPPDEAVQPVDALAVDPVGCADHTREAYVDLARFPTIAGCAATWLGAKDLRAPATGAACGNDGTACVAPADACAAGWHICVTGGDATELRTALTGSQCDAEPGSYVAAASHCTPPVQTCTLGMTVFPCPTNAGYVPCTQPICCGTTCDAVNACQDAVWPGQTHENAAMGPSCGTTLPTSQDGVLCCVD
jgi:hypothetical protein